MITQIEQSAVVGEDYSVREHIRLIEPRTGFRRWGRNLLALAALSASSAVPMLSVFPAETRCGPHDCEASIIPDPYIEIDLGALGPGRIPAPAEISLPVIGNTGMGPGVKLQIQEIPTADSPNNDAASLLDINGKLSDAEIKSLAQLYVGATESSSVIAEDIRNKLLQLGLGASIFYSGAFSALGARRRQEIVDNLRRPSSWVVPATLSLLLASPFVLPEKDTSTDTWDSTGELFVGTPLEGLQTKGELWRTAKFGIKQVADYIQDVEDHYKTAAVNAVEAIEKNVDFAEMKDLYPNAIVVFGTSDEHCNVKINEVFTEVAKATEADIWNSRGDMVIGGTIIDPLCVELLSKNMIQNRIISPGNHEPQRIIKVLKDFGFTVVDGTVQEVGGLTFLGLPDPNFSQFGEATPYDYSLTRKAGRQLLEVACREKEQPIMLTHSSEMLKESIAAGCATYGMSGHTHSYRNFVVPQQDMVSNGLVNVSGTSGGAKENSITLDKLSAPAEMTIDVFTKESGVTDLQGTWKLTVNPDQSATFEQIKLPLE